MLRNFDGNPNIVSIITSADLSTITTAGYLLNEATNIDILNNGEFQWSDTDIILISYAPDFLVNWFTRDTTNNTFIALQSAGGGGGGVTPAQVQQSAFNYGIDTGTADNYAVDLTPAVTVLTDGLLLAFTPANANTSPSVFISINGLDPVNIFNYDNNYISLIAGQLSNTQIAFLIYSVQAGGFFLLNPAIQPYAGITLVQRSGYNRGIDTGIADAYIVNTNPDFTLTDGAFISFTPAHNNATTTPTLTVGSNSAVTMTTATASVALSVGQIATTQLCQCVYSSAADKFLVLTPA
jgi:hypothetical protein